MKLRQRQLYYRFGRIFEPIICLLIQKKNAGCLFLSNCDCDVVWKDLGRMFWKAQARWVKIIGSTRSVNTIERFVFTVSISDVDRFQDNFFFDKMRPMNKKSMLFA